MNLSDELRSNIAATASGDMGIDALWYWLAENMQDLMPYEGGLMSDLCNNALGIIFWQMDAEGITDADSRAAFGRLVEATP